MQVALCFVYILATAVLSHLIGEALPRIWFHPDQFPYAPWKWERGGKIYQKLGVQAWKDKLPDTSKIFSRMVQKRIPLTSTPQDAWKVTLETCVAEIVHWVLMLLSFVIYLLCPTPLGAVIAIVYGLSHIPFIIIQRYNRPTLLMLAQRLKEREERLKHANSDTLSQYR